MLENSFEITKHLSLKFRRRVRITEDLMLYIYTFREKKKPNLALPGQLGWVQVQKILPIQTFDSKPSLSWNDAKLFVLHLAFLVLYWIHLVVLEIDSLEPYKWKEGQ